MVRPKVIHGETKSKHMNPRKHFTIAKDRKEIQILNNPTSQTENAKTKENKIDAIALLESDTFPL